MPIGVSSRSRSDHFQSLTPYSHVDQVYLWPSSRQCLARPSLRQRRHRPRKLQRDLYRCQRRGQNFRRMARHCPRSRTHLWRRPRLRCFNVQQRRFEGAAVLSTFDYLLPIRRWFRHESLDRHRNHQIFTLQYRQYLLSHRPQRSPHKLPNRQQRRNAHYRFPVRQRHRRSRRGLRLWWRNRLRR